MVWVGNAFFFSFIYHIFSKHFLNIKYVVSMTLGPEDTKIKSVCSLTTRGPLSYRRRNQKVWSTSSLIANVLLTPVLWPGIRWHGPAGLLGAFKLVRSQPGSPSPTQHSFFLPPFTIPLGKVPNPFPTLLTPPPTFSEDNPPLQQLFLNLCGNQPASFSALSPSLFVYSKGFHLTRKTCFFT